MAAAYCVEVMDKYVTPVEDEYGEALRTAEISGSEKVRRHQRWGYGSLMDGFPSGGSV